MPGNVGHIFIENKTRYNMRALFSVSDKTGVVEFASQLVDLGWEIIATGRVKLLDRVKKAARPPRVMSRS